MNTTAEVYLWGTRVGIIHQEPDKPYASFEYDADFEKYAIEAGTGNREALLQLYNALNGTDYKDASRLQIVTIENAVYIVMKNDLAFVITGTLNLYEHQSTCNPNMLVRFLIYLAEEYQMIVEQAEESIYGSKQISLPTPQCVVFYNGETEAAEEQVLRLSDAFENKERKADVELTVRMLNINHGHNKALMEKCRTLEEYAQFVAVSRAYAAEGRPMQEALEEAIVYCIDHGILSEFLRRNRCWECCWKNLISRNTSEPLRRKDMKRAVPADYRKAEHQTCLPYWNRKGLSRMT